MLRSTLPQDMPDRSNIGLRPVQGQCDDHFFHGGDDVDEHSHFEWPGRPPEKQRIQRQADGGRGDLGHPGVIAGISIELVHREAGWNQVTGENAVQKQVFAVHDFGPQPPAAETDAQIGGQIGPGVQHGAEFTGLPGEPRNHAIQDIRQKGECQDHHECQAMAMPCQPQHRRRGDEADAGNQVGQCDIGVLRHRSGWRLGLPFTHKKHLDKMYRLLHASRHEHTKPNQTEAVHSNRHRIHQALASKVSEFRKTE